jgi:integrase
MRRGRVVNRGDRRRPNWSYVVDVSLPGAPRRQVRKSGFRTRDEAQGALNDVLSDLQRGTFIESSKVTVAEYLEEWLAGMGAQVRPSTLASYTMNLREHILPTLGGASLQGLTPDRLNALYADLLRSGRRDGEGLSPKSIRNIHATIRKALSDAVDAGRVTRNVAALAKPPKLSAVDHSEMRTWTAPELRSFLELVADDDLYAAWHTAASTGLRRGEVLGLRWADLDLDRARASIRQTVLSVGYEILIGTPKTGRGRRSIALDSATVTTLRSHRKSQAQQRMAFGGLYEDHGLVFARPDGSPIHPQVLSDRFDRIVVESGLPRIRFHDLRHTHATLALQAGVHPKVVSERLGHSTVAFTLDVYSHAIPAMQEDAAELIAALVAGARDPSVTKPRPPG